MFTFAHNGQNGRLKFRKRVDIIPFTYSQEFCCTGGGFRNDGYVLLCHLHSSFV